MDQEAHDDPVAAVAQIIPCTEAEGPGRRWALWFQGCPLRCPGCCNPEFLPFQGGESIPLRSLIDSLDTALEQHAIEGITLLGGEPFAHAAAAARLAQAAQQRHLSVMVFTGYLLTKLRQSNDPDTQTLLNHTDVLVDGPYLQDQPDTTRRWIGSRNQGRHFLTNRYHVSEPCWSASNTLEIRIRDGVVLVNGFPSPATRDLWKGWHRPDRTNRTGGTE